MGCSQKLNAKIAELEAIQKTKDDQYYIEMIKAIRDFMCEYPEVEKFSFIGEF